MAQAKLEVISNIELPCDAVDLDSMLSDSNAWNAKLYGAEAVEVTEIVFNTKGGMLSKTGGAKL